MTKANANALFRGLKRQPSFNRNIHVRNGDPEDRALRAARSKIRRVIREAFGSMPNLLREAEIRDAVFAGRDLAFREAAASVQALNVRFLTQGSHAYGTLVRPAQPRVQEIDLDDGVYFPMPFLKGRPLYSSAGLFLVVERALEPLMLSEGWEFAPVLKSTCIRVNLTGTGAHIDLPLFAVDETSFLNITKLYEDRIGTNFREASDLNAVFSTDARSVRLEADRIVLAHREEDWISSDPKTIHDWFTDSVNRYGKVLRRLCRYVKAWRDETWSDSELTSLTIMAICTQVLGSLDDRPADDRDDLLLLSVAEVLPQRIREGGITWRQGEVPLDAHWSSAQRAEYAAAADQLYAKISSALHLNFDKDLVVAHLREALGKRFPYEPDAVAFEAGAQTAKVLSTPPATVAVPKVYNSVSG